MKPLIILVLFTMSCGGIVYVQEREEGDSDPIIVDSPQVVYGEGPMPNIPNLDIDNIPTDGNVNGDGDSDSGGDIGAGDEGPQDNDPIVPGDPTTDDDPVTPGDSVVPGDSDCNGTVAVCDYHHNKKCGHHHENHGHHHGNHGHHHGHTIYVDCHSLTDYLNNGYILGPCEN